MVSSQHYIELYIGGKLIELESQDSLNLRINNVLFNPTKTTTTQAEYSYSFDIPSTPSNDVAFGYANTQSKANKFHARYPSQVYADGELIFDGSLTIQKYDAKKKMYTCNLVNIKVNTIDEIFGDAVLTDIPWEVDFDGANTINAINADMSTKYFFPFVSYGVFQKNYYNKDDVSADYTSKFDLDKYNKWWIETFYPSLNMVELMKKAFEWKGYTVGGDVFSDPNISNIFASCNLADEQVPTYNVGYQPMGSVHLTVDWCNHQSINQGMGYDKNIGRYTNDSGAWSQDLKFPYFKVVGAPNANNVIAGGDNTKYNFSTIQFWNMLDTSDNQNAHVTMLEDSYIYDPTEHIIVVPCSGWYRINLQTTCSLSGYGTTFETPQWTTTFYYNDEFKQRDVELKRDINEQTPLEIQLIRNYDENIELIKGRHNIRYLNGNPNDETVTYWPHPLTPDLSSILINKIEWDTDFPHQDLYASEPPTKTEDIIAATEEEAATRGSSRSERYSPRSESAYKYLNSLSSKNSYGYMHKGNNVMPYDQAVSPAFICGFSSFDGGTVSVMRNGKSWSKLSTINNKIFADVEGMELVSKGESGETIYTPTNYCRNEYKYSPSNYCMALNNVMTGELHCCVWLEKNDILELVAIQRDFDEKQNYATSATCRLDITAITDRTQTELLNDPNWNINSDVEFSDKLKLTNFTNNEVKVSDWINDVQKAFNLEIVQDSNNIDINTNKGIKKNILYAVNLDDRVNNDEISTEFISYPKEMSVRYKIDTEEWGFETTVPSDKIDLDDWKEYGDSGYTVIQLNDDSYETKTQNTQAAFSYTYYDDFHWKEVLQNGEESSGDSVTIRIPVIEKAEYMADGYGYEEAMKHDGYSLTQRFWYRKEPTEQYLWLSDWMHEKVWITTTSNVRNRFNLSYKDSETSIVTEYFNISPMLSSNYVNIEAYLTPTEYLDIKNGALVHFNDDLHYTSEIQGYDPSGGNTTKLKLIKKV